MLYGPMMSKSEKYFPKNKNVNQPDPALKPMITKITKERKTMPTKMGVGMGKGQGLINRSSPIKEQTPKILPPIQNAQAMAKGRPNIRISK